MSKYDINNKDDLSELESRLSKHIFLGGDKPSTEDREVFDKFGDDSADASLYPGIAGWYYLVRYFSPELRATWETEEKKPNTNNKNTNKPTNTNKAPAKPTADDDDGLFDDDEETEEDKQKRAEKKKADLEAKKAANSKKEADKKKAAPVGKSLIILDVKVWEEETDLNALAKKILEIELNGLTWKTEYKIAEIAFGMKKIVIGMVVIDDLISVDDVTELIVGDESIVQSVDIVSFDKI